MKKTALIIVACLIAIITYSIPSLYSAESTQGKMYYYTRGDSTGGGVWLYGDVYETSCDYSQAGKTEKKLNNIIGMTYQYEGDYNELKKLIDKYAIFTVKTETVGNNIIVYGYADKLGKGISVEGKLVNIQIAFNSNKVTIGTPLIMGSY